jgi:hypothetical protein
MFLEGFPDSGHDLDVVGVDGESCIRHSTFPFQLSEFKRVGKWLFCRC